MNKPTFKTDYMIDARGLACPMPLVKARQALMVADTGQKVGVLATDPAARGDFEAFSEATGHIILESKEENGLIFIVVEKV